MIFNTHLPPVGCPLVVVLLRDTARQFDLPLEADLADGRCLVRCSRTAYVTDKNAQYEVLFPNGTKLTGRWKWTYP